jgi:hypothetical protein
MRFSTKFEYPFRKNMRDFDKDIKRLRNARTPSLERYAQFMNGIRSFKI